MSMFKCKMCGGSLEVSEGITVAECEYCGTKQTVPKAMDENLQNLYNRANTLRIKCEFDKAEKLYEKIVQADSTQPEAYWGIILCKYGIEYVDDPATFKKIPTCHRASYDSVIADDDYKSAINNADISQRAIYEEQAKEIERIQKEILALAQKEETYDVFICYKETDSEGKRTQDSVIANDIYYQLTNEGFKVFYAAITLEGKLGSAYEPIIFATLNSAKVMLSIGTKPEYFNAVWVKNEWSRFLKIIQKDRSKLLIPCYRDMDAYELPEEFAHLQAQDMAKIGFINDIVRGIKKVIEKDEPKQSVVKETVITTTASNTNIAPLLKRAFMFLEDGEWDSAVEYCEKVLDLDPECAEAYLGKLMADLKVKKKEKLKDCETPFDNNANFQKAVRFGDDNLNGFIIFINKRNEEQRLASLYSDACSKMKSASTSNDFKNVSKLFDEISDYKDSSFKKEECLTKANEIQIEREKCIPLLNELGLIYKKSKIEDELSNLNLELANLGFFSMKKKKDILRKIDNLTTQNDEVKKSIKSSSMTLEDLRSKLNSYEYGKRCLEFWDNMKNGECIFFGSYKQNNNRLNSKESIAWKILEIRDGKALLISKYGLDTKPYNASRTYVTWEDCTLRKWLNNEFYNTAFSSSEQATIQSTTVTNPDNPRYKTDGGNNTVDKVFLLSIEEANKYFANDEARQCSASVYAKAHNANVDSYDFNSWWGLRTVGFTQLDNAVIFHDGVVGHDGVYVDDTTNVVRPALWISLE